MSTRYAAENAPPSQERYMSSPEFAELRGISGNAVTAKASILSSAAQRDLLYFIQAKSLEPGGLPAFVREVLAKYPDRIGTPTMHKLKVRPEKAYCQSDAVSVRIELGTYEYIYEIRASLEPDDDDELVNTKREIVRQAERIARKAQQVPGADLIAECNKVAQQSLEKFLVELCINPTIEFAAPGEEPLRISTRTEVIRRHPDLEDAFREANTPYFKNIIDALFEMEAAQLSAAANEIAATEVTGLTSKILSEALRHPDRIYVIEGKEGIGKSKAAVAFCKQHAGRARYVSLSGATNKTAILRTIAKALGLASSYTRKAGEMQARIEDMLQRSKLMLVIDEAAYLCSQSERVYSRPEMLDWIYTALANFNVPSALLVTPVFAKRVSMAERQVTWNARQFRRRCKFHVLPENLPLSDLENVAAKLLPECGRREVKHVAAYGMVTAWPLTSVVALIEDARDLAKADGVSEVSFDYLDRARRECRAPSDAAQARAFEQVKRSRISKPVKRHLSAIETDAQSAPERTSFKTVTNFRSSLSEVETPKLLDA